MAVVAVGLAIGAHAANVFAPSALNTSNARFAIRTTGKPSGVVIVGIDADTLNRLGNYPLRRYYDAEVIYNLVTGGARAIAYDLLFVQPTDSADDADLLEEVRNAHGKAVMASLAVGPHGSTNVFGGELPSLGARAGYVGLLPGSDGVIRSFPYSGHGATAASCCLDSLAVATVEEATHGTVPKSEFPGGSAPIDFAGPPGTFPTISFARVFAGPKKGHYSAGLFRDKIVVVGATDPALGDLHATPVSPVMSGPEIWANAIWTLLRATHAA